MSTQNLINRLFFKSIYYYVLLLNLLLYEKQKITSYGTSQCICSG